MITQVSLLSKGDTAPFSITDKRFFSRVHPLVDEQIMLGGEGFVATSALEGRLVTNVRLPVPDQASSLAELLVTNVAGEGFLLGMRSFVDDEVGFPREIASALRALKRTCARMSATMDLEILHHAERRWTYFTLERFFSRMSPLVFDESDFASECFAASVAMKRLFVGVLETVCRQIALDAKGFATVE